MDHHTVIGVDRASLGLKNICILTSCVNCFAILSDLFLFVLFLHNIRHDTFCYIVACEHFMLYLNTCLYSITFFHTSDSVQYQIYFCKFGYLYFLCFNNIINLLRYYLYVRFSGSWRTILFYSIITIKRIKYNELKYF